MFTASLLLAASLAVGQNDESPVYEHLKDLEPFVGSWEAKTVMPESASLPESLKKWAGQPVIIRLNVRWAPGKSAQINEAVQEIGGETILVATAIHGWDESAKTITGRSYTTHRGARSSTLVKRGDVWIHEYKGYNRDGVEYSATEEMQFLDKDTVAVSQKSRTVGGQTFAGTDFQYKRVGKVPEVSNYDRLKELEFLIGDWEARREDGVTRWTFHWTEGRNGIQNVITVRASDGAIRLSNMGVFGWDRDNRRITNWFVTEKGKQGRGLWAKRDDGAWDNWLPGSQYTWLVTILDENTWKMEGTDGVQVFKRVEK